MTTPDNRALWELVEASRAIVSAYRGMPDGELGHGLVNGHFLRIEDALKLVDAAAILERPVVVGDEDVERALRAYNESRNYQGNTTGQAMRAALESMVRGKS